MFPVCSYHSTDPELLADIKKAEVEDHYVMCLLLTSSENCEMCLDVDAQID